MTLGGRFELPSYESTGFPDLRLTGLGYPSFPFLIVWNYITVLWPASSLNSYAASSGYSGSDYIIIIMNMNETCSAMIC